MRRYVSLDSNVLIGRRFDYQNDALRSLVAHVHRGTVEVVLPTVAVAECKSNLERLVREACAALAKAQRSASILRHDLSASAALVPIDEDAAVRDALAAFDAFVESELRATVVDASPVNAEEVLRDYFVARPPFEGGKKKAEFPDAIAARTLQHFAESAGKRVFVVSADGGFRQACSNTTHLDPIARLEELLEEVAGFDKDILESLHAGLEAISDELKKEISDGFENLGFVLDDQDGEVSSVQVEDVELGEWSVLDSTEEKDGYLCQASATVHFSADLIYDDLNTATWDSEDKRYYVHHQIEETVSRAEEVEVMLRVRLDRADMNTVEILACEFENERDVAVISSQSEVDWR